MPCACGEGAESRLIYACSGAANTGLLADQVMRALNRDKVGDSTCLAAMGAELSGFLVSARSATLNIVLDGCKVGCGAKVFEKNSIAFRQLIMTDYDVVKGKTAITGELIEAVTKRIAAEL
ncbi:MAG: putative zinc-binding protein [Spirochaetota bacterium]